ncbi:hypothetical protein [Fluviispira vulneris]|uniref:hypothetical protein n=1 Tax=Fluviispira vulneris TaxID=2763012 RepID=UPI001647927B|nr:hypothetical protein [Fluviispira vulneris]
MIKSIFNFTKKYFPPWFPFLPSYEGYLSRLNALNMLFPELSNFLLKNNKFNPDLQSSINITFVDSLPIMLTKASHAYKCKIASDISSVGYFSSKDTYNYGLKLHFIATYRN